MATKYMGTSCILFDKEHNSILLMKRSNTCRHSFNKWAFPGGGMEQDDKSIYDCAKRECREEIGIDINVIGCLGILEEYLPQHDTYWMDMVLLCEKDDDADPIIMEPDKCIGLEWFSLDSLPEPIATNTNDAIKLFLDFLIHSIKLSAYSENVRMVPIMQCVIED